MRYKEIIGSNGRILKEWRNDLDMYHREDGPAVTYHYHDGSIGWEGFYLYGHFLGYDKKGFWALWDQLTEVERKAPAILACLARFS